ncbi:TlpA disulfide reductase family protein [Fusibacter sp. 3D3]|uniref:TlpA family protein disulfide reductase n=1 Tax=Fusibacter sp. 3D3 TaxID=1048380 RepID=UPI000852BF39|nr:TlpA disulfide reductase family protein [Fusibacter sp. 3D3]GAU77938.1 thiol disulfide oxidoreductase TlpA [Fusibacter sp. 3D3]
MSRKILVLTFLFALLLITACSNSEIETPIQVEEPSEGTPATTASTDEIESSNTNEAPQDSDSATESSSAQQEPYIWEDFELKNLDGTTAQLYDFKDKIVVINFWATWCHFCDQEMPLIEALSQDDKYQVLAINVGEDTDTIQKYLDEKGLSLNVYLDEDQSLAGQFSVTGFPTTVFLGPNAEYLYAYPGMLDQKTLDSILASIDEYLAQSVLK